MLFPKSEGNPFLSLSFSSFIIISSLDQTCHLRNQLIRQEVVEQKKEEDKVPERYLQKSLCPAKNSLLKIPLIDFEELTSTQQLETLKLALSLYGCFQVINHGIAPSFVEKVQEITKEFFGLTVEEKQRYLREKGSVEGCGYYGNDMILSDQQTLDWTDRLYLTIHPQDQRNLNFWPKNPHLFRETVDDYTMKLKEISEEICKAIARSLDLYENKLLDQFGETRIMHARFNFYPPCPKPNQVLGVKPHTDATAITILLPDKEVQGLQFLNDGHWFTAPIVPNALLVNVGDQVEIMSNGIFKSPVHRVVTNTRKERISVAVFCIPSPDKEIGPIPELITDTRPRLYRTMKNYVLSYFQYYQMGRRPIESALL